MATPEPSGRVLTLEGMRDALNSKKSEIEAAHGRLGGKVVGQKGTTASSKMQTERLLKSPGNGHAPSPADPPASSLSLTPSGLSEPSRVFSVPGESTSSMLTRVTRSNRTLTDKVKTLEEELEKYKEAFESINTNVNDISNESRSTDQQVGVLVDELQMERKNHQRARQSLEQETKKVEDQTAKLKELEIISSEVHRENLELSLKIQELRSLAEEREIEAIAATADDNASVREGGDRGDDGEPETVVPKKDFDDLNAELVAVKEKLESTSGLLEISRKKAEKVQAELSRRKTWTEFWKTVWFVWWLVTKIVGYVGFLLFAYMVFNGDNLRSEGIDVYRLAH